MTRIAGAGLMMLMFVGCSKEEAPKADLQKTPQVLVVHTASNVLTYPIAVGANGWKAELERLYPSACIDEDADLDGVPASMDADEIASASNETAFHCGRCDDGQSFRMELRGDQVELEHARVIERHGDIAIVDSPFGAIRVKLDADLPLNAAVSPGSLLKIDGLRDARDPYDTVVASGVRVVCEAPTLAYAAPKLEGLHALAALQAKTPPLAAQMPVLAAR